MAASEFDHARELSHQALDVFMRGDPEPLKRLYSHRDEASLANPFGPPVRGWTAVAETMERAARNFREGRALGFDLMAEYATSELRYVVEIERYEAKVGGSDELTPVSARVTTVWLPDEGTWRIVHRHADTITSARPAESVIQR